MLMVASQSKMIREEGSKGDQWYGGEARVTAG